MFDKITLLPITEPSDFTYFARLVFHETVMEMNMGRIFTKEEAEGYFSHILSYRESHPHSGTHKVYNGDTFLGIASLWEGERDAEVEYMLLPEFWNQGYGTAVVAALEKMAVALPHIKVLKGLTDPKNVPSQRVLIKNGYRLERTETIDDGSKIHIYTKNVKGKE